MIEVAFGEIVEEDSADAARLAAVLEEEVLVAPLLEASVMLCAERLERALAGGVETARVRFEAVIGREVHAAAEPPYRRLAFARGTNEPHVHVHREAVRIAWTQDRR